MLTVTLNTGAVMPMLGYGVFQTPPDETARCVRDALEVGYRLIDTAQSYGNEAGVGQGVSDSGIAREDVFLTTKISPSNMNHDRAAASLEQSFKDLRTDYIDLVLLHQPIGDYPGAYRALEEAVDAGQVRAIGVSNFYPERLIDIALLTRIPPAVNQVETHPFRQESAAHEQMTSLKIIHEAWAPFAEGRGGIFTHPTLTRIGAAHGKTAGQVALRALMQQGVVVIPKSVRRERMVENFDVFDFVLDEAEMQAFASIDDGAFPRIFDHHDPGMIQWLVEERVKNSALGGGHLF
ncbi:aldo/keto reductase [Schaalia sp. 19OD2882]|uniref:aldo/keto reductase n=1 Tax=Schaalia sp. 19OD2882 TaxID=2794089 RepID=UPI001C1EA9DE|nr:aldo/keto reductase [Schaalia sp. 19OD2882]QWW20034.1 aldo/keto reductase [Schaalia sp. 19OD2882]